MKVKRLDYPAIAAFLILAVMFGGIYAYPYIVDMFHPIHLQPQPCSDQTEEELFCEMRYFDDGLTRISSGRSEEQHCCILRRYNLDDDRLQYRLKVCAVNASVNALCGNVHPYPDDDLKVTSEGVELVADREWSKHFVGY